LEQDEDIMNKVREISEAEAVPPWSQTQWNTITNKFMKCQVHGDTRKKDHAAEVVRFVFTHQMFDSFDPAEYSQAGELITKRVATSDFQSLTDAYATIHQEWKDKMLVKLKVLENTSMQMIFDAMYVPNFGNAVKFVQNLGHFITVVKTYTCMQSLVVVCEIQKSHVAPVNNQLMAYVDILSKAFKSRKEFEAQLDRFNTTGLTTPATPATPAT
jgi:hypothetical protein